GGVDLVLTRRGEVFVVQCKHWKAFKVGVDVVRALSGVMAAGGAAAGFVVTSGRFTDDARRFADGRNVKLVDGTGLYALIVRAQQARGTSPQAQEISSPATTESASGAAPLCPVCSTAMAKRVAKRGSNVGNAFWGC